MNKLRWVAGITVAVVLWCMACTVMAGLALFVPLAVLIWGVLEPVQDAMPDHDREFWSLVLWNQER